MNRSYKSLVSQCYKKKKKNSDASGTTVLMMQCHYGVPVFCLCEFLILYLVLADLLLLSKWSDGLFRNFDSTRANLNQLVFWCSCPSFSSSALEHVSRQSLFNVACMFVYIFRYQWDLWINILWMWERRLCPFNGNLRGGVEQGKHQPL